MCGGILGHYSLPSLHQTSRVVHKELGLHGQQSLELSGQQHCLVAQGLHANGDRQLALDATLSAVAALAATADCFGKGYFKRGEGRSQTLIVFCKVFGRGDPKKYFRVVRLGGPGERFRERSPARRRRPFFFFF